jgi:hypothetical protein
VREGSVSLLGFLSHFFGDDFSSCSDVTIQAVLDACADTNGAIRTVGLHSASLITKTFSRTRPDLILTPFFGCAVKENWRRRPCAVNFMASFPLATTDAIEAGGRTSRTADEVSARLDARVDRDLCTPRCSRSSSSPRTRPDRLDRSDERLAPNGPLDRPVHPRLGGQVLRARARVRQLAARNRALSRRVRAAPCGLQGAAVSPRALSL